MLESRALGVRRDLAALAASGLGVVELHAAAIGLVGRYVGTDLTCWAMLDPATHTIGSMVSGDARIPGEYEPLLAESEYSGTEPNTFASLATSPDPVARLSGHQAGTSRRFNEVWRPLGLTHELRVAFRVDGACWGAGGMVRAGSEFTEREVEFLTAVAPAVASATRVAVRAGASTAPAEDGPAIVVAGPRGSVRSLTPAARVWRERLDEIAPGRFTAMLCAVVVGARTNGTFRALLRDARGGWLVMRASRLIGDTDHDPDCETAVTIERASGDHLLDLLLAAYDLTARERDVCHEVIGGRSTSEIAARLRISRNTVQDHLKAVFAKVDVHSRGELVARFR
jgi:DNA-binding CsgD family transcriptional regulator